MKKPFPTNNTTSGATPIASRSLAQSYAALPARTRLVLSLSICGVAVAGIFVSDLLEKRLPPPNSAGTH